MDFTYLKMIASGSYLKPWCLQNIFSFTQHDQSTEALIHFQLIKGIFYVETFKL